METYLIEIIWGAIWLIISEIIWFFEIHDWENTLGWRVHKFLALVLGGFVTGGIYALYFSFKTYPEYTLMGVVGALLVYLYFRTNYGIVRAVVKRNKLKKEKSGRKKK